MSTYKYGHIMNQKVYSIIHMVCVGMLSVAFPLFTYAAGAPFVQTTTASVDFDAAVLYGSVTANGAFTSAWFEYGTDPSMTLSTTAVPVSSAENNAVVTAVLPKLDFYHIYYYRAVAYNQYGLAKGEIRTFTTGQYTEPAHIPTTGVHISPITSTRAASSITSSSARMNALMLPGERVSTYAWFEWGTSPADLFHETPAQSISRNTSSSFSYTVRDLDYGTVYYYRPVIKNANGTVRGSTVSFRTLDAAPSRTSSFISRTSVFSSRAKAPVADFAYASKGSGTSSASYYTHTESTPSSTPGTKVAVTTEDATSKTMEDGTPAAVMTGGEAIIHNSVLRWVVAAAAFCAVALLGIYGMDVLQKRKKEGQEAHPSFQ